MYLDEILLAQKRGEAKGITSVCSAHPYVIRQAMKICEIFGVSSLIESTCNQVNQFGGYTGMTPAMFVKYLRSIAEENQFRFENIILGGDHLGPIVWQNEPAEFAMDKSKLMVRDYVRAGFTKIHLDCSMRLADDPKSALDMGVSAQRVAQLANVAEESGDGDQRYVIGTEVPIPGGAQEHKESLHVTKVEDAGQTIEITRNAFFHAGLQSAWERVMAVVVQPGVEYGDDFVIPYQPEAANDLSMFIESQPMIFEVHSTDYQTRLALRNLVRDHFAILKVGPALTFAFREAVFALAMIEKELISNDMRSNLVETLDHVMISHPEHWQKYYHGTVEDITLKRKFSLSDRIRYYWNHPKVQSAFDQMVKNFKDIQISSSIISQYVPLEKVWLFELCKTFTFEEVIDLYIYQVLNDYLLACGSKDGYCP